MGCLRSKARHVLGPSADLEGTAEENADTEIKLPFSASPRSRPVPFPSHKVAVKACAVGSWTLFPDPCPPPGRRRWREGAARCQPLSLPLPSKGGKTAAPAGETAAPELGGSGSPLGHGCRGVRRGRGGPCAGTVPGGGDSGSRSGPRPGAGSAATPGQLRGRGSGAGRALGSSRRGAAGPGRAGGGGGGEGGSRCRHRGSRLARLVAAAAPAPLPPPRLPPPSFPFSHSLGEITVPPFPDGSRQRHAASRSSSSSSPAVS